jgi:hypothetical protein
MVFYNQVKNGKQKTPHKRAALIERSKLMSSSFENVAVVQKGVVESSLKIEKTDDGFFTVTATQVFTRKNDKIIEMKFTKNGLNALLGTWQAAVEFE